MLIENGASESLNKMDNKERTCLDLANSEGKSPSIFFLILFKCFQRKRRTNNLWNINIHVGHNAVADVLKKAGGKRRIEMH